MKKGLWIITAVLILSSVFMLGASRQNQQQKWDYAMLSYGLHTRWVWSSPEKSASGMDFADLCKNMSVDLPRKEMDVYSLIQWAGESGWELTGITQMKEDAVAYFKRPKN